MLFDPLEEQLDLPAATIQLGDGSRWQVGIVGQEHQRFAFGILDADAAQGRWITLCRVKDCQRADLIVNDAAGPIRFAGVTALEAQIRLGTDNEEAANLMQAMQLLEVEVGTIHHVEDSGLWHKHVEDVDLVPFAIADVDEARDVPAQVEQRMHLHRCLGGTERRPRKHRQAQVAGRRIQRIDCIGQIDTKRVVGIKPPRNADQALGKVGIDAPVPDCIRVRQRVPRYRVAKTHVVELRCLAAQAGFNVAQALPVGQLREGHAQILVETGEVLDLVLAAVACDTATKRGQRQMRHDLRKNEFARVHEYVQQSEWKNRKCYKRSSNRDQPQTRYNSFPSTCYMILAGQRWDTTDRNHVLFIN